VLTAFFALLQAIPSLVNGINAFASKYYDAKTQMYAARVGGDVEVAKAMLIAEAQSNAAKASWMQTVASSPVLSFVVVGFAFPFIFYLNKVIVYDICLGLGSTPVLKYQLLTDWGNVILSGIFITTAGVGVAHSFINRKG
jgi:hypothetical protein